MRYWEIISEEGKIVKGVNTTPDVQPGEMARQGAKLGFTLTPDGLPPVWTGLASFTNAKDTPNSGDPFYDADGTNPKKSAPIVEAASGDTYPIKGGSVRVITRELRGGRYSFRAMIGDEQVAIGEFQTHDAMMNDKGSVEEITVSPRYRRKGIASAIYQHFEKMGFNVVPSDDVRPDGQAFWNGRRSISETAVQIPDHFQKLIRNNHIEVWRAIRAHWGFLNDLYPGDGVGIYWTYNKEFAVAYDASRGGQLFRLHGAIPVSSVDWANTIKVDGSQEYEITAKNGSTITLISIDALDGAGQIIEADVKPGVNGQTYKTAPRNV